jgi:hypothetical protein
MSKIVNISEEKFRRALREVFKQEVGALNNDEAATPHDPFGQDGLERKGTPYEGVEDGHGESTVGRGPDNFDKNKGLNDVINPELP